MLFGQLARQFSDQEQLLDNAEAAEPLVQRTVQAARKGDIGARHIAIIACGAARSSTQKQMGALFTALAGVVFSYITAWATSAWPEILQ